MNNNTQQETTEKLSHYQRNKEYYKERRQRPEEKLREKGYRKSEEWKKKCKEYYNRPEVKQKIINRLNSPSVKEHNKKYIKEYRRRLNVKQRAKEYRQRPEVKQYQREYYKYRSNNDEVFAIKCKLRNAVTSAFIRIKQNKPADTQSLLGCTWEEAKQHIESLFEPGMNWSNHGTGLGKWHIDHIKPVVLFTEDNMHEMNHITNLRPLWEKDNLSRPKDGSDYHYCNES